MKSIAALSLLYKKLVHPPCIKKKFEVLYFENINKLLKKVYPEHTAILDTAMPIVRRSCQEYTCYKFPE